MHRNVTNRELLSLLTLVAKIHVIIQVVCLAPGNIEMRAGRGVSQLMNVAFDMAAWVGLITFPSFIVIDVWYSGNPWQSL